MEASALTYSGGIGLQARTPLLRLQSDERLIAYTRKGNQTAFEVLVARYQSRLLAFCRHLLGSREDAEDILQEVFAAAFNALMADDRPINVRPWLYRIARNRSLNQLRRAQAVGVDSMDIHFSEHGTTTADKVQQREQFRLLVDDIHGLPETQRTALILREMDAMSYDQIAEAMDTTVPGVKSLLVRARISLAEAAEARQLSCSEVRLHLGEVAEGLRKRPEPLIRRHLKSCNRCSGFEGQLKSTSKALGILLPLGPLALIKRLVVGHLGHSASASAGHGSGAGAAGVGGSSAGAAGVGATSGGATAGLGATGGGALATGTAGLGSAGMFSAGAGALATKAAASLAAAVVVTGGAVEVNHVLQRPATGAHHRAASQTLANNLIRHRVRVIVPSIPAVKAGHHKAAKTSLPAKNPGLAALPVKPKPHKAVVPAKHQLGPAATDVHPVPKKHPKPPPGRTETQSAGNTVLPSHSGGSGSGKHGSSNGGTGSGSTTTTSGSHTSTSTSTTSTTSTTPSS